MNVQYTKENCMQTRLSTKQAQQKKLKEFDKYLNENKKDKIHTGCRTVRHMHDNRLHSFTRHAGTEENNRDSRAGANEKVYMYVSVCIR